MIHVIEQDTATVAVNDQTRLNKREISSVDRKGARNRSLARNSMLNEHLEWETSNESGTGWNGSISLSGSRSQDLSEELGLQLSRRVVDLLRQNPPLRESGIFAYIRTMPMDNKDY